MTGKKRFIIILFILLIPIGLLPARDSNGDLFHYRLSCTYDLLWGVNHFADYKYQIGNQNAHIVVFSNDFLFYKSDDSRFGPKLNLLVFYENSEEWTLGMDIAFLYEHKFFFLSVGMTMVGIQDEYYDWDNDSSSWNDKFYYGFYTELGFIIKPNRKSPEGFVFRMSVSANPLTLGVGSGYDDFTDSDLLGDVFRESIRLNFGFGYTF